MNPIRKRTSPLTWRFIAFRAIILLTFAVFTLRVTSDAPRGVIYDRNGELLVRNIPGFTVTIIPAYLPEDVDEEWAVFTRLSELLDMPASRALTKAPHGLAEGDGITPPEPGIKEIVNAVRYSERRALSRTLCAGGHQNRG